MYRVCTSCTSRDTYSGFCVSIRVYTANVTGLGCIKNSIRLIFENTLNGIVAFVVTHYCPVRCFQCILYILRDVKK